MANTLTGKVIIVTGAGRGVGAEIAKMAAREGAKVVVNDLGGNEKGEGGTLGPAEEVVAEIVAAGGEAIANGANVASWDGAHELFAAAMKTYGDVDAIVNNAGILRDTMFHKMGEAEWDAVVAVNMKGCFNVARAAAPHFKDKQKGAFVHMTSTSGLIGNFGQVNYGAAKMGVAGLSKCIALDMAKFGVRSNCIAPFAWTRLVGTIPATPENAARIEVAKQMTPDKIAPFTLALCSDAAKDVTGQIFGVRRNEILLFSQPRPIRSVHTKEGWTPESCIETALPALRGSFYKLDRSADVFTWDPI
ncbi:SDR family NAD(P)-dependent oxidoreductase [Hydrocarboniphaga sp.]|uniref:SDR family NAD(P)-dependent oxidoreductase n=1 Tax=Hydrocarboniphaga sp. TaxID=2033016 RepID=UPI003D0BC701